MVGEVAGENRREVHPGPLLGGGPDHRAGELPGERLQLRAQFCRRGFEEDRDDREIDFAALGEGLHRVEDRPVGEFLRDGGQRHASGRVGDGGALGDGKRRGDVLHGLVTHGDQVDVGVLGEHPGMRRPVGSRELRDDAGPFGVPGEDLHEFEAAFRNRAGQRFRQVPAADDDDTFHGIKN